MLGQVEIQLLFTVYRKKVKAHETHEVLVRPSHVAQLEKQLEQGPLKVVDQYPGAQTSHCILSFIGPLHLVQAS